MGHHSKIENDSPQKPAKKAVGSWGERVAVEYLIGEGYGIVEVNWHSGHYEIDIIAQKGIYLVFVEVKTRRDAGIDPVLAVTRAKMQRIVRAADTYMRMHDTPLEYRFDIITITGSEADYSLEHLPDAFYPTIK